MQGMNSSSSPPKPRSKRSGKGSAALTFSIRFWFVATVLGQWIFAAFVALFYGKTTFTGEYDAWGDTLTHGYEAGNSLGNFMLIMHLLPAAIIMFCGPLQFVPQIRARFPAFHRWSGKIYLLTAFILSLTGLYLGLSGRKLIGDSTQHYTLITNAILILIFSVLAFMTAIKRDFKSHRRWAMHLFAMVSGVWLFRMGLFAWLMINGGKPVWFDYEAFSGPFLTVLAYFVYIFTIPVVELYIHAKKSSNSAIKIGTASLFSCFAIIIILGTFAVTMGLWLPKVQSVL